MRHSSRLAAVAIGLALLSDATPTVAQGLPTPEQRAFAAVDDARYALEAASGAAPMLDAAHALLDSAGSAYRAFSTADQHRDAAGERLPGRWSCEPTPSNEPLYIIANNNANWAAGVATECEAVAAYAEAVGFVRSADGYQLAERLRRLANRFRGVQTSEQHRAVLAPATSVCSACSGLHTRATEAHFAANRAALVTLGRATRAVATAAERLTVQDYPGTRATEVLRAVQAANRAVSVATDPQVHRSNSRTDTVLESLIEAARVTVTVARAHRAAVERAVEQYEQLTDQGSGSAATNSRNLVAPSAEPEVLEDLSGWARAIRSGVAQVERAAAEAEAAAASSGSWFSRVNACHRATRRAWEAVKRIQELTIGAGRPSFVSSEAGSAAYEQVRSMLDAAGSVNGTCTLILRGSR